MVELKAKVKASFQTPTKAHTVHVAVDVPHWHASYDDWLHCVPSLRFPWEEKRQFQVAEAAGSLYSTCSVQWN